MSDSIEPIDPYTASPPEFLRALQQRAAEDPSAFGSWRSRRANESVRDPAALEATLEAGMKEMQDSLIDAEASRSEDIEQSLSGYTKKLLNETFPDTAGNRAYHLALTDLVADTHAFSWQE